MYRKRDKDTEIAGVYKRLKKTNNKIITSYRDYLSTQGGTEEEIDMLDEQQPSAFSVQLSRSARQRLKGRVEATARLNRSSEL